ncbi:BAR-domain-containing protein [Lactarius sanguifluus]|nr:BAR-domain-containing protein [Lactarius sanguifluus]
MSWQGFKKSMNRAGTTLLQKTGQIERTVDQDFASEEAKYKVFEKECGTLQKDGKSYLDSMRAMSSAQLHLAETIDTFYGASDRTSESAMAAHAYKRSVEELDTGIGRELLGKMNSYFPTINEHISKRNKKMAEKPSEDATKLPKAQQELDEAKEVFDLLNDQLVREIPILLEQRVPYFDPSFEAMIRMQCKFAEEGYEKLSGVQRYFDDSVRDDYAAGQLDAQVEGVLQEMRELSICGAA